MLRRVPLALVVCIAALTLPAGASAATLPAGFDDTQVATVPQPTALAFTPDGRLLVTSQAGPAAGVSRVARCCRRRRSICRAKICPESSAACSASPSTPTSRPTSCVYLYYTFKKLRHVRASRPRRRPGQSRVALRARADDNAIDPASEAVLIDSIPSPDGNHNARRPRSSARTATSTSASATAAATTPATAAAAATNDAAARPQRAARQGPARHRDGGIPPATRSTGADSARCNVTGSTAPGTICQETYAWGLRNPFRIALRPQRRRHALPHQRRRRRTPGRRSTTAAPAPTTAGTCARGTARPTRRPTAARRRPA